MKLALLFIFIFAISIHGFGINVKYGEVIIHGFEECAFENNGNEFVYKSYDENFKMENILLFGLINYNCNNHTGTLISKFECKPCGLFCSYNQSVPRCRHVLVPYILGGILGAIVGAIICIFSFCLFKHNKEKLKSWYNYKILKRNDKKRIKVVTDMKKVTGINANVNFKEIKDVTPKNVEKNQTKTKQIHAE